MEECSFASSDKEFLRILRKSRKKRTLKLSKRRLELAGVEQIRFSYLRSFLSLLLQWEDDLSDGYLEDLSGKMRGVVWKAEEFLLARFENCTQKEKAMKEWILANLGNLRTTEEEWRVSLKRGKKRASFRIQKDWSSLFYQKLDDIFHSVCEKKFSLHQGKEFFLLYESETKALFHREEERLFCYLRRTREGFLLYMEDLMGWDRGFLANIL